MEYCLWTDIVALFFLKTVLKANTGAQRRWEQWWRESLSSARTARALSTSP